MNKKKVHDPIRKEVTDLEIHVTKEDIHLVSNHAERCSTSLVI
jgi:hypothetical protein